MNIEAFLKARREAGQDVTVTEIQLSTAPRYTAGDAAVVVTPVAHAVSFLDEHGHAVTALIVGEQAGLAVTNGENRCPQWTEHDVSDPGITL